MPEQAVRLNEALIALATWPLTKRFVSEVSRAHGYANPPYFNVVMQHRFGRGPREVLAMRAVWPAAKFQAWLQQQADQHGFRARLDEAFANTDLRCPGEARTDAASPTCPPPQGDEAADRGTMGEDG